MSSVNINIFQSSKHVRWRQRRAGLALPRHYASLQSQGSQAKSFISISKKADRIQEQLVTKEAELAATPAIAEGEAVPLH